MSAATDKARFYLEQSIPELKEYEKKEIFSKVGSQYCLHESFQSLTSIFNRMKLPRL